jgi:hypothetical protein
MRAANLVTITASAVHNDLDAYACLLDVLQRAWAGDANWTAMLSHIRKADHPQAMHAYRQDERR